MSRFADCWNGCGRVAVGDEFVSGGAVSYSRDTGEPFRCPLCRDNLGGAPLLRFRLRAVSKKRPKIRGEVWFCIPGCVTAIGDSCNCPCGGKCHGIASGKALRDSSGQIVVEAVRECPGHPLDELKTTHGVRLLQPA